MPGTVVYTPPSMPGTVVYTPWYMPGMRGVHPWYMPGMRGVPSVTYPGMGGVPSVTYPGMGGIPVYTPPGYGRDTPRIYTTLGIGRGTPLGIYASCTTLGIPASRCTTLLHAEAGNEEQRVKRRDPGLNNEINMGKIGLPVLRVLLPVTVVREAVSLITPVLPSER